MRYLKCLILILTTTLFSDVIVKLDLKEFYMFKGLYNTQGQSLKVKGYELCVSESGDNHIKVFTDVKGIVFVKMLQDNDIKGYKGISK